MCLAAESCIEKPSIFLPMVVGGAAVGVAVLVAASLATPPLARNGATHQPREERADRFHGISSRLEMNELSVDCARPAWNHPFGFTTGWDQFGRPPVAARMKFSKVSSSFWLNAPSWFLVDEVETFGDATGNSSLVSLAVLVAIEHLQQFFGRQLAEPATARGALGHLAFRNTST